MTKVNRCIYCHQKNFEIIEKVISNIHNFNVYKCVNCGLFFQNPMPTKKFLKKFYQEVYERKYELSSTETAFLKKDINQEKKRIEAIERYMEGGKLLDIGASTGFFLSEVKKRGNWEGYGIEYSKKAANFAHQKFGLSIIAGDIQEVDFLNDYFDIVTMHSVFEHIPDPLGVIQSVRKKLKPGGFFVFNVPNIRSFEYYLFWFLHRQFPGFIFEHLFYFTPRVIKSMLEKNGFKVVLMTSRHHSTLRFPNVRPFIGFLTFFPKLFLEYTDLGGKLGLGNVLYIYAKKID